MGLALMRELIKEMLAYICLIAMSGFWLFVLLAIAINGTYSWPGGLTSYESNAIILFSELVLSVALFSLGIERLHSFIKRNKGVKR